MKFSLRRVALSAKISKALTSIIILAYEQFSRVFFIEIALHKSINQPLLSLNPGVSQYTHSFYVPIGFTNIVSDMVLLLTLQALVPVRQFTNVDFPEPVLPKIIMQFFPSINLLFYFILYISS